MKLKDVTTKATTDLNVWDAKTGKRIWRMPDVHVNRATFSADTKILVGVINHIEWQAAPDGQGATGKPVERAVCGWKATTGEQLWKKPIKKDYRVLTSDRIDTSKIWAFRSRSVECWDAVTGDLISETDIRREGKSIHPRTVAFSPDMKSFAVIDFMARNLGIYETATGEEKSHAEVEFPSALRSPAFSRDLTQVVCDFGMDVGPAVIDVDALLASTN